MAAYDQQSGAAMDESVATVSFLPQHDGDGYSWGGGVILTIGDRSLYLGAHDKDIKFARELARRWNGEQATPKGNSHAD